MFSIFKPQLKCVVILNKPDLIFYSGDLTLKLVSYKKRNFMVSCSPQAINNCA